MKNQTNTKQQIKKVLNTLTDSELQIFNFIYNEMKYYTNNTYQFRYQDLIESINMIKNNFTFNMIISLLYKKYIN